MRLRTIFFFVTTAATMLLVGCSKNSSSPTDAAQQQTAPLFPTVTFSGPSTSSTDPFAQTAKSLALAMNVYTSYYTIFSGTTPTQSGSVWTWKFTQGNWSVTFSATQQSDGSYVWKWVANGTDPSSGKNYSNWTLFQGSANADGKNGDWKVYQDNSTVLAADFQWATNTSSTLTGTLKTYDANGVQNGQINVINNADHSGEIDQYTGAVVTFKETWIANGSGQWWTYNNSGTQTGHGTWN